jgi:TPP-dependent 2-oxoacid decarboxylase
MQPAGAFLFPTPAPSDPAALGEAIKEALKMLDKAQKPVVIGDVELIRFKLQKEFAGFLDKTGFPYVTMMLGKTVLSEHHPQFIGLFEGDRSRDYVRNRVESADCILQLGALMTDFNTGGFTTNLDDSKTISANIRSVKIKHHYYENVYLHDFILGLTEKLSRRDPATLEIQCAADGCVHRHTEPYRPDAPKPLTIKRFFDRMSHFMKTIHRHCRNRRIPLQRRGDAHAGRSDLHRADLLRIDRLYGRGNPGRRHGGAGPAGRAVCGGWFFSSYLPGPLDDDPEPSQARHLSHQ